MSKKITLVAHRAADPAPSGIGRYYTELVSHLAARGSYRYSLGTTRESGPANWLPAGLERFEFPGPRKAVAVSWAIARRPHMDAAFGRPDLIHALHPWTATPTRSPLVTTVHDLMPMQHPDWYPRAEAWLYRRGIEHARDHASLVIADSAQTCEALTGLASFDPSRIRIVHLGVGDEFRAIPDPRARASACQRHGVEPGRFLIAVGQVNDRKNLDVVLRALRQLDPALLGSPSLLVAGGTGRGAERVIAEIDRLGLRARVRLAGYVPAPDLPLLLGSALALVHPSHAEGFGMTPIEAMAAGVPALTSDRGALPEVVGSAGVVLDADDEYAWAAAITHIALDPDARRDIVRRGTAHQERFRWTRVAEETERVYAEVLGTSC